jgi:molybdate transport system substrate-binding protein
MPNPAWEGVGNRIIDAYRKSGGKELEEKIMVQKVKAGTTFLTQIHHRQTPVRIMLHQSDAGPVWYTEPFFQKMIKNFISLVEIPEKDNVTVTYVAGKLKEAPHQQAAEDFINFLTSPEGQAVYKKYNFLPVEEKAR